MLGSTWHRWDLHYHTQSSYDYKRKDKSNQDLVDELVKEGVDAVVVTDHHMLDFDRIDELNKLAKGKIIFFRGIEITSELGGNESVHFIAIFPDSLQKDEIRDSFLAPLGITKEKTARDNSLLYKAIPYDKFLSCANDLGALISIHAGSKSNSIENIKNWCRTKQDFKQTILEKIHILETSKTTDFKDYTGVVFKDIGKEMPIVVCSDYHSEYAYGMYTDNSTKPPVLCKRPTTWIKSDLSFDGLKQIIFEPQLRVKVQENNPSSEKFGLKLESLTIKSCKLFQEKELLFNEDMIAIIGEKGSGKTALLDMVAHILGVSQDDPNSFLQRGISELKNSTLTFNMYGDDTQTVPFPSKTSNGRCRYINPTKLSSFCDNESSMQSFIKSIIMNDEITKEFGDINVRNLDIQSLLLKIDALDVELAVKDELIQSIKNLREKISIEEKNKPNLPTADEATKNKFQELGEKLEKNTKSLEIITEKHVKLVWFDANKDCLLNDAKEVVRKSLYESISLDLPYELFKVTVNIDNETLAKIEELKDKTNLDKEELKKDVETQKSEYEKLKTEIFKNQELQKRYEKWQGYINELKSELLKLMQKDESLKRLSEERQSLFEKCMELYRSNIISKKIIFKYFYDLKGYLSSQIGNVDKNKISFSPVVKIETLNLLENLERIISLKSVNEETLQSNINSKYKKIAEKLINPDVDLTEEIKNLVALFIDADEKNNLYGKKIDSKIFKNGHKAIDLYKIAFGDFININYEISFNGIPMDQLSSGQKGIVLLKLLLRLDKTTDPLLIDQPEDNLDNKSVYDQLVSEFKLIKQKRQLFIATHNPNLVINTDAEQIIVAEYRKGSKDGYISYCSGSIEDKNIRKKICKILEGGEEAFINREKRYNFHS